MNRTQKIWLGLGAAVAVAAGGVMTTETAQAQATDYPGAPYETVLKKMLGGEGGEAATGFTSGGATVTVQSLNDAQLKQALPGNTLRKDLGFAVYFDPSGTVEGWRKNWSKAERAGCPTDAGENHVYHKDENACFTATNQVLSGKWTVKGGQICMPSLGGKPVEDCYNLTFLYDRVALSFEGKVAGGSKDLVKGKQLAASLKK